MSSESNTALQWGAASIAWTPNGYILRVPAYLDARAVSLIDDSLLLASIPGSRVEYELEPAVWKKTDRGTSVEPGELRIRWPEGLPDAAGQAIREPLDRAVGRAMLDAERATEQDEAIVDSLLRQLRGEQS